MKNKPDPALLRHSNLLNEIKKGGPKSRETFPLIRLQEVMVNTVFSSSDRDHFLLSRQLHPCSGLFGQC
jgi:hypothetical protein